MTSIQIARLFLHVRESTKHLNDGPWVEAMLRFLGLPPGNPWCACYVCVVEDLFTCGNPRFPKSASCETIHQWAKKHNKIVKEPRAGDLFLVLNAEGRAHHVGLCADAATNGKVPTVEGNTNVDGSRDGYGVFERKRTLGPLLVIVRP